ncbi:MAG: c-type cytochrome biogenesis protein CcmI, partial [Gammaproteobacteria bacterium]|nr:c-type cytochrome biogenesis protein CcmI [Gammaproteobacteria bacterium]
QIGRPDRIHRSPFEMTLFLLLAGLLTLLVTLYLCWPLMAQRGTETATVADTALRAALEEDAGSTDQVADEHSGGSDARPGPSGTAAGTATPTQAISSNARLLDLARSAVRDDAQARIALEIHAQRHAALEHAITNDELDRAEAEAERKELERAILDDLQPYLETQAGPAAPRRETRPQTRGRPARLSAAALLLCVPVAAVMIYLQLGAWPLIGVDLAALQRGSTTGGTASPEQMVARLEQRLREQPQDGAGWRLLGRSYLVLGKPAAAVDAYQQAVALLGEQPDLLVEYAEAESVRDGYRFSASVTERLERALQLSPDHPKALLLGGLAALQGGDQALARERITRVLDAYPPDSAEARTIRDLLSRAGLQLPGERGGNGAGDEPAASAAGSTERPQAAGALLHVTVDITPQLRQALAAEVDARDRQLFVFARPANGPRMPLAARRLPADQLPIQLTLSDEDGMLPGRTLASAGSVIVGARISTGGNATASSGDLQGFSTAVDPNTQPRVTVVIDSRVP